MNCSEAGRLLDAYVDGELELLSSLEIEQHLSECPACTRARAAHLALRESLRAGSLYFRAPAGLEKRVRHAALGGGRVWWGWAAAAVAAVVAVFLFVQLRPSRSEELLAREVVTSHIRSLMTGHLTDVASSDQHTVKPWFNGRVDFSPPVRDLAAEGFPLVGGRMDYVGRPVAALVYQRRKHLINAFVWPASGEEQRKFDSRNGYNVVHWTRAGMTWWLVSDLNSEELERFAALF